MSEDIQLVNRNGKIVGLDGDGNEVPVPVEMLDAEHAGIIDGTPINASHEVQPSNIEIGVTADWHWSEDERLLTLSTLKSRIDTWVDAMNDLQPAFCIHLGDVVDGNKADQTNATESEIVSRLQDAFSYVRTQAGSDGTGLDMPLLPIAGDHEHFNAGNWNMSNVYDAFNTDASDATKSINTWNTRSEAYYKLDLGGWRLLFVNTGYKDSNDGPSKLSTEQMSWIQDAVDTEKKICLINHVPIPDAYPYQSDKDSFQGQQSLAWELRDTDVFSLNGHVHHHLKEGFDAIQGPYGKRHVMQLSKAEHEVWSVLRLRDDGWSVTPSYLNRSTPYIDIKRGPFTPEGDTRSGLGQLEQNGVGPKQFNVGNINQYDRADSGVTARSGYPTGLKIEESSSGSRQKAYIEYGGVLGPTWGAPKQMRIGWYPESNTSESFEMLWGTSNYSDTFFGFEAESGTLYALSADSAGNETKTSLTTYETGARYVLEAEYYSEGGTPKIWYQVTGVPSGNTTRQYTIHDASAGDNIPTSSSGYRPMMLDLFSGEDALKSHTIMDWKVYGPTQRTG